MKDMQGHQTHRTLITVGYWPVMTNDEKAQERSYDYDSNGSSLIYTYV